jgi:hypothetical protein
MEHVLVAPLALFMLILPCRTAASRNSYVLFDASPNEDAERVWFAGKSGAGRLGTMGIKKAAEILLGGLS